MLIKQPLEINFQEGLDQKTDPYQVRPGKFLGLVNSVFDKVGRLTKRNGFERLESLSSDYTYTTTFDGNLTALGQAISAFAAPLAKWVPTSSFTPITLSTHSLIRNSVNQTQVDSATASNGLVCTAYSQTDNFQTTNYYFSVLDSTTGQQLVAPTLLIPTAGSVTGSPRVFVLGNHFVVVFTATISAADHLQYQAISSTTLMVGSAVNISSSYQSAPSVAFDGVVANNSLYLAWNGASASGMKMTYIDSTLTVHSTVTVDGSHSATVVGVWADITQSTPIIWTAYWNSATQNLYILARSSILVSVLAVTLVGHVALFNITGYAKNQVATLIWEQENPWGYDANIKNSNIIAQNVTEAGVITSLYEVRSVGLGSKGFLVGGNGYVTAAFGTPYQPSYFVLDNSGNVVAKLAYQNGGGFLTLGLPSVSVFDTEAWFGYLIKDLIQAVNKNTAGAPAGSQVAGIYSQTGINLAAINFSTDNLATTETGNNLNVSGGFLWGYDGVVATENNFFVWPELILSADGTYGGISTTPSVSHTFTGDTTIGSNIITNLSAFTARPGEPISGTGIPPGTVVIDFVGSGPNLQISQPATATGSSVTFTVVGGIAAGTYYYQFTYEYTDNQGNFFRSAPSIPVTIETTGATSVNQIEVPYLNLTYKTANKIKIVGYRWSQAQPIYYQFTSVTRPILNDKSLQLVTITDASSDPTILGNNIIYTTGGVLENVNPPAFHLSTLFDDRLWVVDDEDKNLLWYSKQVIESTPVEMSDLLTYFVSPTIGGEGPTGEITALAAMDDKLIIFKKTAIYYVNGIGPDNTGANSQYSQPFFIMSPVGCDNQASITMIPSGLMFQSDNGIWLLGRDLSVKYIGASVEDFNSFRVTSSTTIPKTNQVRFSLSNGSMLMYDYFVGQWGEFQGIPAISSCIYNGLQIIINQYGEISRELPGSYLDGSRPVLMSLKTAWLRLQGLRGYQRSYFMFLLGTFISPHKLQMEIAYDYNSSPVQSNLFTPDNYNGNYGADPFYGGDGSVPFGGITDIEQCRMFFEQERCKAFQITITEVFDPSFDTVAGAGLTLSGLNLQIGFKKGYAPISASRSVG